MFRYFSNKYPVYTARNIFLYLMFISGIISPQTKSNLEVLYSLNDSLVNQIVEDIPHNTNEIILTLNLGKVYSIFSNQIRSKFRIHGKEISVNREGEPPLPEINIVLEEAAVQYGEMERDGWFGDYYVTRTALIKGNYLNTASDKELNQFFITVIDTVNVEDLELLENDSFPFTKGVMPEEPFLSSVWEPVIAIGVAAAAIVLFFTVRSK